MSLTTPIAPPIPTTNNQIPTKGLTTIHANAIVKNPITKVSTKAIKEVPIPKIFARKGMIFAKVEIISKIIENQINIKINPNILNTQVIILLLA